MEVFQLARGVTGLYLPIVRICSAWLLRYMADTVVIIQQRRKRPLCPLRAMVISDDGLYATAHPRNSLSMLITVQPVLPYTLYTSSTRFSAPGPLYYLNSQLCVADTPALHLTLRLRLASLLHLH